MDDSRRPAGGVVTRAAGVKVGDKVSAGQRDSCVLEDAGRDRPGAAAHRPLGRHCSGPAEHGRRQRHLRKPLTRYTTMPYPRLRWIRRKPRRVE